MNSHTRTYQNDRFLRACRGEETSQTPVWIMRQAGRYLPEYRAVRQKATFRQLLTTPDLATEVTLQPLRRYPLDAGILFSDILVVPEAMGVPFEIVSGKGPVMDRPVRTAEAVAELKPVDPEADLPYLLDAVRQIVGELDGRIPLIGFAGAPFTLACYLVEGTSSRDHWRMRRLIYESPELATDLLTRVADGVTALLRAQIEAGVAAVQVFESWAGVLTPAEFSGYAMPAIQRVLDGLAEYDVPKIVYAGHTEHYLPDLVASTADVLGVDWRTPLPRVIDAVGGTKSVQGNLEPCALFADEARLGPMVDRIVHEGQAARGHVFNLGHGILPQVDPAKLGFVIDRVHAARG